MQDPVQKLSWDDLRIVRAIGRSGALAPAAKVLGVNISTIARRLNAVEAALGATLFERRRTGYLVTRQGQEMMTLADRVELDVVSVVRRVSDSIQDQIGTLRITTSDSLLLHFLTPVIASFSALNEGMRIEVIVGNNALNLARGESDIAIRATDKPPENLFGRKVATIAWAPYAHISRPGTSLPGNDRAAPRKWVSYGGKLADLKASRFVEATVRPDDIAYRTDSVASAAAGIAAGMGAGYLPCMLGDITPGLVRIGAVETQLNDELWLLTHPEIRKSGRIYAFMTHCIDAIGKQRSLIEGRRPQGATDAAADDLGIKPETWPAPP